MKKKDIYNFGNKLGISNNTINKIILKITDLSKNQLFLVDYIDYKYIGNIEECFIRVVSGEPIEYILENAEFYGLDFFVDSRCLIPRDDTEVMVDEVLKEKFDLLIDVGTGSSCIPIAVLKNLVSVPNCFVIDLFNKALEISKINIKKYNLENKITQINGSLLDNFGANTSILCPKGDINLGNVIITANLPYIKDGDFDNMDKETVEYEPDSALFGGKNTGFELYEKLIQQCLELQSIYNIKKLFLFIEIGFDQKEISEIFLNKLNLKFKIFKDNGGIDRCVKIEF